MTCTGHRSTCWPRSGLARTAFPAASFRRTSTIRRVLSRVDDEQVTAALGCWLAERIDPGTVDELLGLAVEGKSVRGAVTDDGRCVHLLSPSRRGARAHLDNETPP